MLTGFQASLSATTSSSYLDERRALFIVNLLYALLSLFLVPFCIFYVGGSMTTAGQPSNRPDYIMVGVCTVWVGLVSYNDFLTCATSIDTLLDVCLAPMSRRSLPLSMAELPSL